jgi:peptidoglycan hydrolase-like protein with peptidoglycan-binding domain
MEIGEMKKFIAVALLVIVSPVHSGFLDQFVNEAKKTFEDGLQGTMNSTSDNNKENSPPPTPQQTQPKPATAYKPVSPSYDKSQVREIQQGLNSLGYNAGTPDGLYGNGTRKAIEAFQKDHGIVIDGKPSTSLLAELKTVSKTQPKVTVASSQSQSSGAFKPNTVRELGRAAYIATLHYHPEVLEEEKWLKNAATKLFPEESSSYNKNEFTWQKNKAELKARIIKEIADPPLTLTASWSNQSGGHIVIVKYNFNHKAF